MKTKGLRQSKNVEVQTEKQRVAAGFGKKLQDKALDNTSLRDGTAPVARWGDARDEMTKVLTNPGRAQTAFPSTKSPSEKRKVKDPKPEKMSPYSGDNKYRKPNTFSFLKHEITEK